jgi:hypothetical protein
MGKPTRTCDNVPASERRFATSKVSCSEYLPRLPEERGMMFRLVLLIILSMIGGPAWADHIKVDGVPRGIFDVNWCRVHAKSRLLEMNHGLCKRMALKYGNKHQNELGKSAIVEICRGHPDRARGYLEACQCHNPGMMANIDHDWPLILNWAKAHADCIKDRDITEQCRPPNYWRDDRCNPPSGGGSTPPPMPYIAAMNVQCSDRSTTSTSNIGRGNFARQIASRESCDDARSKLRSWVGERDRCMEQHNLWRMESWKFQDTDRCRLP